MRSHGSQWNPWLDFFDEDRRFPLPATEGYLVAFIERLKLGRKRGDRCVGSLSVPQYLSAVRRMHLTLTGAAIP